MTVSKRAVALFAAALLLLSARAEEGDGTPREFAAAPDGAPSEDDGAVFGAKPTTIALPERRRRTFFSAVDPELLSLVEDGSPSALKEADARLRALSERGEDEDVLLFVADAVLSLCWKSEGFSAAYPSVPPSNQYVSAIASARRGSYDRLSGGTDFLSLVLPSLVLVSSSAAQDDFLPDARAALEKARELRPGSVLLRYLLGILFLRLDDFPSAERSLSAAHEACAGSSYEIGFALARSLFGNGKYADAYSVAKGLSGRASTPLDLLMLCAESSFRAGDMDGCESFVARVLQREPENTAYILFRAKVLVMKGEYVRASSLLDAYARTDTEAKDYLLLRATIQREWNKNARLAEDTIQDALSRYADDADVLLLAAEIASDSGRSVGGLTAGELSALVLAQNPASVPALKIQVRELMRREEWIRAYAESSRAVRLSPDDDELLFMHITVCLSAGKKDEAWERASRLYQERGGDEGAARSYVEVLVATGRASEAARVIAALLPGSSQKLRSFLYYQKSFLSSGEENVMADLRSSLTANPRNRDALFRLYQLYFNKKEYRKAQYYLKQVVAISPDDEKIRALDERLRELLSK